MMKLRSNYLNMYILVIDRFWREYGRTITTSILHMDLVS